MTCAKFFQKRFFSVFCAPGLLAIFSLTAGLCGSLPALAQEKASAPQESPKAADAAAVKATAPTAADIAKEALVFDKLYTQVREESDGTGSRQITARIRILSDAGVKAMAVQVFTYTALNQQIDIGYVRVIKPDGSVVVTPDYNVQDLPADVTREAPMYSDIHQKHVAVKGLGVGDTLEYQVTLRTLKPEVPGQFWMEYSFQKDLITLDEQVDLDLPADKTVAVVSNDLQPTVTTTNGRKLYHWASTNLARPDPDAPPKSVKNWKPSVEVTTFSSWEQVGAWYKALEEKQLTVTPAIQAKVAALTKGLSTDDEKVHAIFNDVALHIHYVGLEFGIGRYQPHPADDVLSNEYGDCKDKHTLLATMLKAAGIDAWPVLIPSSRTLDAATPSPAQFDHVITLVPLHGKLTWMDSTEEVAPVGSLMTGLRDKQALAIPTDKPAYLERTPVDLPYPQSARFEATGKLSDQGVFTGHINQIYRGDMEILLRSVIRSVPQSEWKTMMQRFSNGIGFAGEVSNPQISPVEETSKPLELSYDYTREKFGEWDNHRIMPPLPPVGWELNPGVKEKKPADEPEIGSPGEQDYIGSVELPKGWVGFPPRGVDLKEDWAEYHASYSITGGVFNAERRLLIKKNKVPLEQWERYQEFRRAIYNDEILMTPLFDSSSPQGKLYSMQFGNSLLGFLNQPDDSLKPVLDALDDANRILGAQAPASPADLNKALEQARKAVDTAEAKSLANSVDDFHSLYWTEILNYAWSTLGWAALESKDLPTAESYLQAAWHLGQEKGSGFQLARLLEAKGDKSAAAHQYLLTQFATYRVSALGGDGMDISDKVAANYLRLTGKEINKAGEGLNKGKYDASPRQELDKETDISHITKTSKLTGSGLYALVFEPGKSIQVKFLGGDKGFEKLDSTLKAVDFHPDFPSGSRARIFREIRVICTPYAGCDGYLQLPGNVTQPESKVVREIRVGKNAKSVEIPLLPAE